MATLIEDEEEIVNRSYLNARVFSILAQNRPYNASNVEETTESKSSAGIKPSDNLQIYLRIKMSQNFENLYEIKNDNTLICKVPKGAQCNRNNHTDNVVTKRFKFSKIFGPETSQSHIFTNVIQDKMIDFINGVNCTMLTYGASGSGKTFTVVGNSKEPGIIPRSLEFLFSALPQISLFPTIKPTYSGIANLSKLEGNNEKFITSTLLNDVQDVNHHRQVYSAMQGELQDQPRPVIDDISNIHLSVWISFAEIYNEYVYDLLAPTAKQGKTRKKLRLVYTKNNAYVKDLKYVNVSSASDAYCVLQYGIQNLNFAATSINEHSSRSHSIFTIRLAQASDTKEGISISAFNFCDLAGSERIKKTNNVGDRLKESNNINTSLMVLGRCISAIRDAQKFHSNQIVPYRDSKFTQLFQNALSGNECIFMIVNVNPTKEMFDESQHVLNFSALAKDVSIEQQQLIDRPKKKSVDQKSNDEIGVNVEELQIHMEFLCDQIKQDALSYEEEREYIVCKYKDMIADTWKFWEGICKNLQIRIAEKENLEDFADTTIIENERKRKKISIITISSSSDEESDVDEISGTDDKPNKKPKVNSNKLQELQDELRLLKSECANQIALENIITKNENMTKLLEETEAQYNNDIDCQEQIERLESQISLQDNTLAELNNIINLRHSKPI